MAKYLKVIAILALLSVAIGCSSSAGTSGGTVSADGANYGIGQGITAPDFQVSSIKDESKTISLKDFSGKPLLINFWASWCGPCRAEAPSLQKAYKKYNGQVEFLGIAIRDQKGDALEFMKEYGITFPIGLDPQAKSAFDYGVSAIPATFLVDSNGKVAGYISGALTEAALEKELSKLLAKS